jgi:hypothetical protein
MSILQTVDAKIHFFASHAWTHSHHREGLHAILRPWVRGIDFQDYSVSRAHPLNTDTDPQLARELRSIIGHMDALLIMAGMYANNSPWMQFEIDMAFAFNVPIIPVLANGQERVPRLPTRLATFEPVRWRGDSIREALLRCVSLERGRAIQSRVALVEAIVRRQREEEAARRAQAYNLLALQPPLYRNALYLDPQSTPPANSLADLFRRR